MPIRKEDYERVTWMPCPDCWSEREYEAEMRAVKIINEQGDTQSFPDLDDPMPSPGYQVAAERIGQEEWSRTFWGCETCGGAGRTHKKPGDDCLGKSWHQWVVVEGGVTLGTGMVPKPETKRLYGYFGPGALS